MKRKDFLKTSLLTTAAVTAASAFGNVRIKSVKTSDYEKMLDQVGFNHLPNKEEKTMKTVFHAANSRGQANHGWLNAKHTFSFANYHNPERMHFGVLRVLNDDQIQGGKGFGKHPHDNMEIITIPLSGAIEHEDSMGNKAIVKAGEVQVMSAGTGILHSEVNPSTTEDLKLFQIWLFPNKKNVEPRYDQIQLDAAKMHNNFLQILSPNADDKGVWIHQDAWFHLGEFEAGQEINYTLKNPSNGLYIMNVYGDLLAADKELSTRDGYGIWETPSVKFQFKTKSKVLLMELPMKL